MRHKVLARLAAVVLTALVCLVAAHGSVLAQTVSPKPNPSAQDIDKAKRHMAAGVAFIQDPDGARYEEAYPEFKHAYELSGSLNALQNLAICAMKLELDGEAIEYFERFLQGEDLDEADKAQVERDLGALKAAVAWITVASDKPNVTLHDLRTPRSGAAKRNRYTIGISARRLGVHPGSHEFTAVDDGGKSVKWTVEIKNGEQLRHDFTFDPNAPVTAEGFDTTTSPDPGGDTGDDEGGTEPLVYVAGALGAVTGVAVITWAVFMGLSASKKSEYDNDILGQRPLDEQQEAADDLKTTNLVADVMLGVSGALAIATVAVVVVLVTSDDGEEAGRGQPKNAVSWKLAPSVDPRGGGAVMVTGEF